MATYMGMCRSNAVPVAADPTIMLDEYHLDGEMHYEEDKGVLWFGSTATTFAAWDHGLTEDRTEEFLNELTGVLKEPITIRSVGWTKLRHVPDAFQWIASPDGTVEVESLEVHNGEDD